MAEKKKAAKANKADQATVTRIKAVDDTPQVARKKSVKEAATTSKAQPAESPAKKKRKKPSVKAVARPFTATGGYFKGAWQELKQVRWPTRRATWSLTFAVIVYSAFFIVIVLLLDALFKYLFELMLGK